MVLISEVSRELSRTKLNEGAAELIPKDGVVENRCGEERAPVSENTVAEEAEVLAENDAASPAESFGKGSGKPVYNEHALRVAHVMRSYLNVRGGGDGVSPGVVSGGGERCRAMMEVVRRENGRWLVSKVVLEHVHLLLALPDTVAGGRLVPAVGMEFDSISMAKAFYYTYSESIGFKARTGSGRRSRGNRTLLMQRFLCSKGNYPSYGNSIHESLVKRKRGPYRKRAKLGDEGSTDGASQVGQVESMVEKAGVIAGDELDIEGHCSLAEKGEILSDKDNTTKPSDLECGLLNNVHAMGIDGQKLPMSGNPAQSRLLRELGIRVSKYSHEERRDIILRYMRKRSNRQVVDRSMKVPSRQALAERRQRGFGGKFLSKEDTHMQALNKLQETAEEDPEVPPEVVAKAGGVPIVGMSFESEDKAYGYYVNYAAKVGFSVRKGWWDKSAKKVTRSRLYVCSREGFRPKNSANEVKKSRPETRTGCPAKMTVKITSFGRYRVTDFVAGHNHQLAAPIDIQMLKSHKLLSIAQGGRHPNADLIPAGYKNYIRAKRAKCMKVGDAGIILDYLQKMKAGNPSFYYAIQVDEDDKITNVFWVDAKSMIDYHCFGDALCFHTPYKTSDNSRPLALFLGVNHHKQFVIFGSAFLYDETTESLKWLFQAFKTAMSGKQPKTIFIDQCTEIENAVAIIWPGTRQRFCIWAIYQHAFKHLAEFFQASESFEHDFCQCIFDFEEEEEFLAAWALMLEKYNLKGNDWLAKVFEKKEKWALVYGRDAFCADMQTTLRTECLSSILKEWLNQEADPSLFFRQYERLLEEKRYAELQADYHANQGTPRIPPLRMLWQAANIYTPAMFEVFRREFELFMNCVVYNCGEVGPLSEYEVTIKGKSKAHFVRFDSMHGTIICSCKKFLFVGIQCCHVLKVLDLRNIKELPQQYILKRWRKNAKAESLLVNQGLVLDGDPNSSVTKRYNSLCRALYRIAERAAENVDAFTLMVGQSDQLIEQVERILQTKLLEKPPLSSALKGQLQNPVESQISHDDNNSEALKVNGKRRKEALTRRRLQVGLEVNKRHKPTKGQPQGCDVAARDIEPPLASDVIPQTTSTNQFISPSHFMQGGSLVQGPYVTSHQFGLAAAQGFHAMTQFGQESSASILQQPFHGSTHLNQATIPGYPTPEMHALQFVGNNPQLDHQGSDQGHCNIPVWDFL